VNRRFDKVYVGSNLKMYKTNQQTVDYVSQLQQLTRDIPRSELKLFILPSYTALADACRSADHELLWIGAQNMHWEAQGPYTGEISPVMLREINVDLVMVGHAERRQLFGETDWMVNQRLLSSLAHGFHTLLCVGDTAEDIRSGVSAEVLRKQLQRALYNVTTDQLEKIWVAYEPVWAIGEHGKPADPNYANEMHAVLRRSLADVFPGRQEMIPLLYGGSVDLGIGPNMLEQPEIDGLFIGRAAWDAAHFNQILRQVLKMLQRAPG
jgi:triosephosphate isomerase